METHAALVVHGEPPHALPQKDRTPIVEGLVFYPGGEGDLSLDQKLVVPGPAGSYAAVHTGVRLRLPCEANAESVRQTAETIKTLENEILGDLRQEAVDYLIEIYGQ